MACGVGVAPPARAGREAVGPCEYARRKVYAADCLQRQALGLDPQAALEARARLRADLVKSVDKREEGNTGDWSAAIEGNRVGKPAEGNARWHCHDSSP